MRRRLAYVLVPLAVLGLSAGFMNGCRQGEGERCQIDSDCDQDLDVCNEGTGLCQPKGATGTDAIPSPDAHVDASTEIDATPFDATPFDATPFDATPFDAT